MAISQVSASTCMLLHLPHHTKWLLELSCDFEIICVCCAKT